MRVCLFRHSPSRPVHASTSAVRLLLTDGYDRSPLGKGRGVGVLQRFERRLGGLVEGTFAKVFKGEVQPVEIASALQREADDRKTVVAEGRVLVPNDYVVELGSSDYSRLAPYEGPLGKELASMVSEHADEQGYSFVGPVKVRLEEVGELDTGSTNGVRVNDVPTTRRQLSPGDRVEMGSTVLIYQHGQD